MQCANCGTQLPQGANACPSCGTISPLFHKSVGSSADGSTAVNPAGVSQTVTSEEEGKRSASSQPQKPATYYGSQPYYTSEVNPYAGSASNPYEASSPYSTEVASPPPEGGISNPYGDLYASSPYRTEAPPPPPTVKKRKKSVGFVIVLCVVLLAVIGAGVFVFVIKPGTGSPSQSVSQNQPASSSDRQALYNETISTPPVMNDALSGPSNFGVDNYTGQGGNTRCFFRLGQLHSLAKPTYFSPCYAVATNYQDFILQVKMSILLGHSGGLVFRADYSNDKGYQFRISMDGTYVLNRIILDQQGNIQSAGEAVTSGSSALVHKGFNQTNQLAVIAQGNTISLFINGKYVASATDSTYKSGQVGVYVDADAGPVEGAFNTLQVWKLS